MENCFKVLLVLVLASMVNSKPLTFLDANPLQFIAEAVGFYNGESLSDVVFKLYKEEYDYKVGPKEQKQANFTIKETVCQKSENQTIENCEFKFEGVEKSCTASNNDQEKTLWVTCTAVTAGTKRFPESGYVERPRNPEDDYADQAEEEASPEDHVTVMDENDKTFLEGEDEEERRIIDKKLQPGQFLGRFLCLECFFDILPRK
ncbi:lutzicidin-like [Rhinoderma darwinii]|uniref:lutzicidin-like n=1 Tax=Rhinoderma darwinii TaxID=43563 RepID=UPI003F66F9C1